MNRRIFTFGGTEKEELVALMQPEDKGILGKERERHRFQVQLFHAHDPIT